MPELVRRSILLYMLLLPACGAPLTSRDELIQGLGRRCPAGEVEASRLESLRQEINAATGVMTAAASESCTRSSVSCRPVSASQGRTVEYLFGIIGEELARYPAGFLSDYGPKRIWLVNDLKSESIGRAASGIAVYSASVIYLSIPADCAAGSFRKTIQHELFHIFDPRIVPGHRWETAWSSNNPPGFSYSGHHADAGRPPNTDPPQGFASWYARTTAYEDRAESFAHGLVEPWADSLEKRIASDQYLAAKQSTLSAWLTREWPELSGLLVNFPR